MHCHSTILPRPCEKEQQLLCSVLGVNVCISIRVPKHAIKIKIINTFFFFCFGGEGIKPLTVLKK